MAAAFLADLMRYPLLIAGLLLPLGGCALFSVPGSVDYTGPGSKVNSTGGSGELDVTDIPNGCHNWHIQGSATLSDINIVCTYTPATGQFSKTVTVKSADTIQQLIEADKNAQAIAAQAIAALQAAINAIPKPVP